MNNSKRNEKFYIQVDKTILGPFDSDPTGAPPPAPEPDKFYVRKDKTILGPFTTLTDAYKALGDDGSEA